MSGNNLLELPTEWKWIRLKEIGELIKGVSYEKKFASKIPKKDYIAILRANNIKDRKINFDDLVYVPISYVKDEQKIKAGDILIAMSSGSKDLVGKAAQAEQNYDVAFGTFCGLIRFSTQINKKYFGFYFQSKEYKNYISKLSSGININNLRREHIENINLPFAPLFEQQKIVDILEEAFSKVDAGVEGLKKIKKLLSLYRQSVLKYAFEGKLTQKWREENKDKLEPAEKLIEKIKKEREKRYQQELEEWKKACEIAKKEGKKKPPKPKPPKELPSITEEDLKNLSHIPKEWKWVRLEEVVNIFDNMRIPLNQQERAQKKKRRPLYPYYGATGKVDEIDEYIFDGEYVLLGEDGVSFFDKSKIKAYIVKGKFWANNHVHILKAVNGIENSYLMYYLNTFDYHGYVTGTTRLKLNQSAMKNIPVPLSPLLEQQKIIEEIEYRLSIADKLEETVDRLLKLAEKLKQSYLKYAYEGKLTKEWRKQNPHLVSGDNSVDKLLEKIKEEKEKFEKQKKKTNIKQRFLIDI